MSAEFCSTSFFNFKHYIWPTLVFCILKNWWTIFPFVISQLWRVRNCQMFSLKKKTEFLVWKTCFSQQLILTGHWIRLFALSKTVLDVRREQHCLPNCCLKNCLYCKLLLTDINTFVLIEIIVLNKLNRKLVIKLPNLTFKMIYLRKTQLRTCRFSTHRTKWCCG